MLTLPLAKSLRLSAPSPVQWFIAHVLLHGNFSVFRRVTIHLEGLERVPPAPVIFALNHTDRFNYFPLQYRLLREHRRYTASWVKGKYYDHWFLRGFMERINSLPAMSRGYLITQDFAAVTGRAPQAQEYRILRDAVDAAFRGEVHDAPDPRAVPAAILERPRDIFGLPFDPTAASYTAYINRIYAEMTTLFVEMNGAALAKGLDLVVFPEGTRSVRLGPGHIGLAQVALHTRATIVPVGCNGSDLCYPGNSPFAKPGEITYRFGEPITYQELAPFHPDAPFVPLTGAAERRHAAQFRGVTHLIMERIAGLLDARHLPEAGSAGAPLQQETAGARSA